MVQVVKKYKKDCYILDYSNLCMSTDSLDVNLCLLYEIDELTYIP